jgi:hypothetical protein
LISSIIIKQKKSFLYKCNWKQINFYDFGFANRCNNSWSFTLMQPTGIRC